MKMEGSRKIGLNVYQIKNRAGVMREHAVTQYLPMLLL